jgi:hypothetical protein
MTSVFIGSAGASRELAGQIATWLEAAGVTVLPWYEDVFACTNYTLENLEVVVAKVQGAVLLFSEDHALEHGQHVANGNVIFEAGLFVGRLGRNRVAICRDGNPKQLSNLDGVTYIDVSAPRRQAARRRFEEWAQSLHTRLPSDACERIVVHASFRSISSNGCWRVPRRFAFCRRSSRARRIWIYLSQISWWRCSGVVSSKF